MRVRQLIADESELALATREVLGNGVQLPLEGIEDKGYKFAQLRALANAFNVDYGGEWVMTVHPIRGRLRLTVRRETGR